MASKTVRHQIQLVVIIYVIVFVLLMYVWQKSGSHQVTNIRQSSVLQQWQLQNTQKPQLVHREQSKPTPSNKSQPQLVIAADTVNVSAVNASGAVGVMEGEGGADHTLRSRLASVFQSVVDCPPKLPLDFLGMNWSSADLTQDPACSWIKSSVRNPEQNFVALGEEMAVLRNVTMNPRKFTGTKGGETIESVFKQNEDSEYFKVQKGFFSLPCHSPPQGVKFRVDRRNYRRYNHLNQWFGSLTCSAGVVAGASKTAESSSEGVKKVSRSSLGEISRGYVTGVTLALERFEYANVYHTMLDWYNVFLSVLLLGIDPNFLTFVIVDGHPWGKLDATWANMFGGRAVVRAGHLPGPTRFEYMVWVPNGYHCPLFNPDRPRVPFLPQLREYFFRSYGMVPNPGPNCRQLRMLLIRRRDYLAHPRNPKGTLQRKIDNENEIRDALTAAFPPHQVRAEQLDLLPMREQLSILRQTDILVGMHGAALAYTILLPEGAGLVEMYPLYAGKTSMLFKNMCKWRGIHYVQWMNRDRKNEKPNKFTHIPIPVITDLVTQIIGKMCPGK